MDGNTFIPSVLGILAPNPVPRAALLFHVSGELLKLPGILRRSFRAETIPKTPQHYFQRLRESVQRKRFLPFHRRHLSHRSQDLINDGGGDLFPRLGSIQSHLAGLKWSGRSCQEVRRRRRDGQIGNKFRFGTELLSHHHELPGCPIAPAKFSFEPRPELAVGQKAFCRQKALAGFNKALERFIDLVPNTFGGGPKLFGLRGLHRSIIELKRPNGFGHEGGFLLPGHVDFPLRQRLEEQWAIRANGDPSNYPIAK
jgi:hypothetical protein